MPHWPDSWIGSDYYNGTFVSYTAEILALMARNNISIWAVMSTSNPENSKKPPESIDWEQQQRKCLLELKKQAKVALKIFDLCRQPEEWFSKLNPAKPNGEFTYPSLAVDGLALKTLWNYSNRLEYLAIRKYYPMKLTMSLRADTFPVRRDPWDHIEDIIERYIHDLEGGVNILFSFKLAIDIGNIENTEKKKSPIIVDVGKAEEQRFFKSTMFYAIGQFSRYIIPQSRRIDITVSNDKLRVIGFERPDHMIALIVYNYGDGGNDIRANISDRNLKFCVEVPSRTIQTILYRTDN